MMLSCLPFLGRLSLKRDQRTPKRNSRHNTNVIGHGLQSVQEVVSKPGSARGVSATHTSPPPNPPSILITKPHATYSHSSLQGHTAVNNSVSQLASDPPRASGETSLVSSTSIQTSSEVTQTSARHDQEAIFSEELQDEFNKIRKLMLAKYASPTQVSEDDPQKDNFLSLKDLRGILAPPRLHDLFKELSWYKKEHLQRVYNDYLCIIATLIEIGWRDWHRFGELFFAFRKENKKSQKVQRDDAKLPFERSNLAMIFPYDRPLQMAFHEHQYKYKHEILQQDIDYDGELPRNARLPFIKKDPIRSYERDGYESSRPIYRVEIGVLGIRLRTQRHQYKENQEPELVAMKAFRSKVEFDIENHAQKTIKDHLPNYDHIVISYTSFLYRNEYCILYPWADGDLQSLCYGTFPDFSSIARDRFTPKAIMKQLQGLAQGLNDLHTRYGLHHYDLKLENVFVYDLEVGANADTDNRGVGWWKIGDFGLAKERIPQSSSSLAAPANTAAERSSRDAPRSPGPYQAPEMRQGGSVNSRTDNFSLGCIIAVVYVFMLGGPIKVLEFEVVRRQGYDSDQFFTNTERNKYEIKPEILEWLKNLQASKADLDLEWRSKFIKCIEELLTIERDQRTVSALEAAKRLDALSAPLKDRAQLWSYGAQEARRAEQLRSDPSLSLTQPSYSQEMDRDRQGSLDGANIALSVPDFPPPHNILKPPLFARLGVMKNVLCAKLNSRWAAFADSDRVIVYDLGKLIETQQIWSKTRSKNGDAAEHNLLPVPVIISCSKGFQFLSVQLADSFVMVVTAPTTDLDDRFLQFRSLKWSNEKSQVTSDHITHIRIHKDCFDVQLSAQGAIAFIFRDHIEVSFPMSRMAQPNKTGKGRIKLKEPEATFRGAAFSEDGSYLCTWYYSHIQNWRVWKIHTEEAEATRQHWRYTSIANTEDIQNGVQHFAGGTIVSARHSEIDIAYFYVLDEDRRIWLVAPGGNEMIEPSENYCMVERFGAWLPGNAVFILGDVTDEATLPVDVVSGIPGSDRWTQPQVEVVNEWANWELTSNTALGGFVRVTDHFGNNAFVIAQSDGSLMLLPIA